MFSFDVGQGDLGFVYISCMAFRREWRGGVDGWSVSYQHFGEPLLSTRLWYSWTKKGSRLDSVMHIVISFLDLPKQFLLHPGNTCVAKSMKSIPHGRR